MNIIKVYGLDQSQIKEFGRLDEALRECLRTTLSAGWGRLPKGKEGGIFFIPSQGVGNIVLVQVELFGDYNEGHSELSKKVLNCLKAFFPDMLCQCSTHIQHERLSSFSQK